MEKLPGALGWLGLTLILLPFAVICLAIAVALVIASPLAGIIFAVLVFGAARLIFSKGSPG